MIETKPIDMQSLRVFVATAQDCNMSRAAERLGVSQSAVSQTIRLLEDSFGTPLLNRSARPLTLTPAGIALFNRGGALLEESMNLKGAVIEASKGIKPSLRIGLVDSFASTFGTALVQQMLRSTAQLSLRSGLTPILTEALSRRELDLAVTTRSLELDGVANHVLLTERFVAICPTPVTMPLKTVAHLAALARELPVIRFNQQSHLGEQVDRAMRRIGLSPPRRLEVETADTLTAMVAGGIGWAITTPLCLLQAARSAGAVRHAVITDLNAERALYLQVRAGEYGDLAEETAQRVREIMRDHILPELNSINPALHSLIRIHNPNDHA